MADQRLEAGGAAEGGAAGAGRSPGGAGDCSSHRAALREGEPCPLCGAKEHPYGRAEAALEGLVVEATARVEALEAERTAAAQKEAAALAREKAAQPRQAQAETRRSPRGDSQGARRTARRGRRTRARLEHPLPPEQAEDAGAPSVARGGAEGGQKIKQGTRARIILVLIAFPDCFSQVYDFFSLRTIRLFVFRNWRMPESKQPGINRKVSSCTLILFSESWVSCFSFEFLYNPLIFQEALIPATPSVEVLLLPRLTPGVINTAAPSKPSSASGLPFASPIAH